MDNILNNLYYVFKRANPTATDEEINNQIKGLNAPTQNPPETLGIPSDKAMELNIPSANDVPSSYDVNVSDNTVTNNGNPDTLASGLGTGKAAPNNVDMPMPEDPKMPTEEPMVADTSMTSESPKATPTAKPEPSTANILSSSNDNASREKMMEDLKHKRMLGGIASLGAGIGDAVQAGASTLGAHGNMNSQQNLIENQRKDEALSKEEFEDKLKNDPNSDVSKSYRQMVLQVAPDLAQNKDFINMSAKSIGDKLPLIDTMMKARAQEDSKKLALEQMKANKDISLGLKEDQNQDKLQQQAISRISSIRGDSSIARVESQRDGAISAYNLIDTAQKEGRELTKPEYYDLLGQIWKARTGGTPGPTVMADLEQKVAKGDINSMVTYVTGHPMGATSKDIMNNLKAFVQHTGELADKQHDAYMAPHLIKPTHLKNELWEPIAKTARGMSFSDSIGKQEEQPASNHDPLGILK